MTDRADGPVGRADRSDDSPDRHRSGADRRVSARTDGGGPTGRGDDRLGVVERLPGGSAAVSLRREVAERYEPYLGLDPEEKGSVRRWGLGSIVSHWLLVVSMIVVAGTGFLFWTGWYGPLNVGIWDGYQTSFYLHTWGGVVLAVLALVVFPFYHRVADGHRLVVSVDQLKEEIVIALSFVGLMAYIPGYKNARRTYDEDEGEWVGYHPMQTVFWYVTWGFVAVLTLTGFALWVEIASDPAWWIAVLGFTQGWATYETMLLLHLIATFWVIAAVAIHAYFAVMPGNVDFLRSMVVGTVDAWTVDGDEPDRAKPVDEPGPETPSGGVDDD